jgi:iron complex transport system ATP-binding protein
MNAVDINELTVRAGSKELVSNVTLHVEVGTWLTVIGPNGAGKTSLVESVAGLRRITSGSITISGEPLASLNERERARLVALVPQRPSIPNGMNVKDYVALGRTAYHGLLRAPSAGDRAIVDSVLERMSLTDFRDRDVATLSGGERQRMVLARALAQSTMVIVLDEPTTGLDLRHQMDLLELLRKEVSECGLTIVATLHDLTLAGQFADRLVLLEEGKVILDGLAREVIRREELSHCYQMSLRVIEIDGSDVIVPVRDIEQWPERHEES